MKTNDASSSFSCCYSNHFLRFEEEKMQNIPRTYEKNNQSYENWTFPFLGMIFISMGGAADEDVTFCGELLNFQLKKGP